MNIIKNKIFIFSFLLLLFYTFSIFYRSDSSFDQDLGRHIKLGEIIINTHAVPKTNLFSYTNPDFPFVNHHFLFEVFIYLWSKFLDLQFLLYFKIVIVLISVGLILSFVKKNQSLLFLPLSFIFLHVLRERTDLRPEIFSFLFTSLSIFILERFYNQKKCKVIFLLPLIQLFWINTHIYFFLGLLLQLIYILDLALKNEFTKFKKLLFIFSLSIVLSLLNPNSINGLLYPLQVFNNYGYTIAENQSIFLLENIGFNNQNFIFIKLCTLLILIYLSLSLLRKPIYLKNILIPLLGLAMALTNIRSFPYLVYLSLPIILSNLNIKKFAKIFYVLFIFFGVLLLFESFQYLNGNYYKSINAPIEENLALTENGKQALDFMLQNNLPQPIYNNFDIGSYIIYRAYPKYKVFVDGRPEAYPADFFTDIYITSQDDYSKFKDLDKKIDFQTVIFSITDQTPWGQNFLNSIVKDKGWTVVYIDDFIIILIKKDVQQLPTINLDDLDPQIYKFQSYVSYLRLGYFLNNIGSIKASKLFIQKAFEINAAH